MSRRTLVLLLLLLVIVVPATAQNFALSVSPAPVCLSVGDARMRAAAPAERPDYTVRIGSAASADVRVGLAETIDEADFVFIEGTDPPRCPTSANRIVRIDATAPTPDLTLGFAAASEAADYRIYIRARTLSADTVAALYAAARLPQRRVAHALNRAN